MRVLLVDDQELVRTGLRGILRPRFGFDIVGELDSGEGIVETVARLRPHVVVMDVRMPKVDGVTATRLLSDVPGSPPVLVLTTFEDEEILAGALRAGRRRLPAQGGARRRPPARRPGGRGRRLLARPRRHRSGARHLPRRRRARPALDPSSTC